MLPPDELLWFNSEVKPCEHALRAYLSRRFPVLTEREDIMQEAYARVISARRAGQLTSARAFLFTVARNLAIDVFRRRRSQPHEPFTDDADLQILHAAPDAGEAIEQQQRHNSLLAAVDALPERCREVMMLRYLDGLSYKEIGQRLDISPNTVKVHIVKGIRDCAAHFRRHGLLEATPSSSSPFTSEESA
jgi:RNA polymerase sigma factor (sigma-70 family)